MIVTSDRPIGHNTTTGRGCILACGPNRIEADLVEGKVVWREACRMSKGDRAFVEAVVKARLVSVAPDPPDSSTRIKVEPGPSLGRSSEAKPEQPRTMKRRRAAK